MKVLVVGSGAREHALAWKLAASPRVTEVLVAPGNGGTSEVARNVPLGSMDVAAIVAVARRERCELTVVGAEGPIAAGVADALHEAGLRVFAPPRRAAWMESSKVWAKTFMVRHGIPSPPFHVTDRFDDAIAVVRLMPTPIVIKASGLAGGTGVTVAPSLRQAEEILRRLLVDRSLAGAGDAVVIEAFLQGRELSLLAFVDGSRAVLMPPTCVPRRLNEGNCGPNTRGMGAYTPAAWLSPTMEAAIHDRIIGPTLQALRTDLPDYRGVLSFGLMVTAEGPWLMDFNVRFGDPEAQVLLPCLKSDLLDLLEATVDGRLDEVQPVWAGATCGVVMTARDYPGAGACDLPLPTFKNAADDGVMVFHGDAPAGDGSCVGRGGRVLTVVGTGSDVATARDAAYAAIGRHELSSFHYRRDIAADEHGTART